MFYTVPFVNYPEHYRRIWEEITNEIDSCLSHGDLIMRQQVEDFEQSLAKFVGVKHAIGLNSGTDALYFSLKAAGVKPGDEVITVSHTFVATIAAIKYCGATPVLIDVDLNTMNMDCDLIKDAITERTKAIIPVHLNGCICNDMDEIMAIGSHHHLDVIEDAAQALGARYNGECAGSFGLTGCFSFYPAKILGCAGDGGALVTNDDEVADYVRLLRDHGIQRSTGEMLMYGYNSRLDNIQAAILSVKLKKLPEWIDHRRYLARTYDYHLSRVLEVSIPCQSFIPYRSGSDYYDVYQNYVIRAKRRDDLFTYLKEAGIETLISWRKPTHKHLALGLDNFALPVTEKISNEVISLPMYPELQYNDIKYVADTINEFYKW